MGKLQLSDEETDALHKEIEAADNKAPYFEDLLDHIHSNPSQQHDVENAEDDSAEKERKERAFQELARGIKRRCNEMLGADGLLVKRVRRNIGGRGFLVDAIDRARRQYDCAIDFDTMGVQLALHPHRAFSVACEMVCKELKAARDNYMRRAGFTS